LRSIHPLDPGSRPANGPLEAGVCQFAQVALTLAINPDTLELVAMAFIPSFRGGEGAR
jgi:hypothetical protein